MDVLKFVHLPFPGIFIFEQLTVYETSTHFRSSPAIDIVSIFVFILAILMYVSLYLIVVLIHISLADNYVGHLSCACH